jgi:hypothetical protein
MLTGPEAQKELEITNNVVRTVGAVLNTGNSGASERGNSILQRRLEALVRCVTEFRLPI